MARAEELAELVLGRLSSDEADLVELLVSGGSGYDVVCAQRGAVEALRRCRDLVGECLEQANRSEED